MFEIIAIKNDMGCQASLWCYENGTARLVMSSTSVDLSNADSAVESFRRELQQLPITELASPQIASGELLRRLSLVSVDCTDSGWICIFYNQDELFTDHVVEMRISPEGKIKAALAG